MLEAEGHRQKAEHGGLILLARAIREKATGRVAVESNELELQQGEALEQLLTAKTNE